MILAAGAAGGSVGSGEPGKGAVISAKFSLTSGTQRVMVVGQKGEDSDQCDDGGGGGGGGTFVAILDQGTDQMAGDVPADLQSKMVKPLLVAGGGGGNDDDAFWNCQQVSADGMDGGLDSSGGSAAYDGGGCNSNGAGFRGDDANNGYTKTFLTGAYAQEQTSWRESGGFGGGAASCNGGGGGGGFWGGRTSEVGLVMGGGKCTTSGGWDTSVCTSGGTSYMASEGANFQAHGAQSKCNGYVIIESCTDATCAASGIPTAGFGGGCSWWPETITSTAQTITSQTTTSHTVTATRVSLEPTVLLSGVAVASLSPDGSVRAWGEAPGADTTSPSDVTSSLASGVVALRAVGRDAFAAMKDDGSVVTWDLGGYALRWGLERRLGPDLQWSRTTRSFEHCFRSGEGRWQRPKLGGSCGFTPGAGHCERDIVRLGLCSSHGGWRCSGPGPYHRCRRSSPLGSQRREHYRELQRICSVENRRKPGNLGGQRWRGLFRRCLALDRKR